MCPTHSWMPFQGRSLAHPFLPILLLHVVFFFFFFCLTKSKPQKSRWSSGLDSEVKVPPWGISAYSALWISDKSQSVIILKPSQVVIWLGFFNLIKHDFPLIYKYQSSQSEFSQQAVPVLMLMWPKQCSLAGITNWLTMTRLLANQYLKSAPWYFIHSRSASPFPLEAKVFLLTRCALWP